MAKESTDNQAVKSKRQMLLDKMKTRYPDLDTEDDEAVSDKIATDYDSGDKRDQERQQFNEMLAKNEYAAPIITGMATGKNPDGTPFDLGMYLIDEYPEMVQDLIEGNDKVKEHYLASMDARRKAKEDDDNLKANAEEKMKAEDDALDEAIKESGYKTSDVENLIDWLYNPETGIIHRAVNFDLKKEDFISLFRIKDFDKRMKEAEDKGYVRGKNEKIDMLSHKQKDRTKLPVINSGGGMPKEKETDPTLSNFDKMKNVYTL
jgi:hypothetical protein